MMILLTAMLTLNAAAQNSVDRMVEECATVGTAKFTSAIERNPRTREVVKVVKTLRLDSPGNVKLRNGFLHEAKQHNSTTTVNDRQTTVIFTDELHGSARVYMLKADDDRSEVTIIVNYKNSKKQE